MIRFDDGARAVALSLCAAGAVALVPATASADWPMSRHDAQRTAAAKGISNITKPQPTWRFPLGGALFYTQQLIQDADGDGKPEFFFVRGSSALGRRIDDSLMWRTPPMDVNAIMALADLDGNGKPELVITVGTNRVGVLDALTGAVSWVNPPAEIGARATVLVGDLDADGLPEILIQDCVCCTEQGTLPGAVYSFAGNAAAPKMLWQLPYATCGGGGLTTLLDLDGDGFTDVLLGRQNGFDMLDGATGAVLSSLDYGNNYQYARCVAADVTGIGEQAVCVLANTTADDSGHRVFAIGHDGAGLKVLWDQKLGFADATVALQPGMVADLDGDGLKEVVVTAKTSANAWSTYVLDAQSGALLATLADRKMIATAPIMAIGRSLLLTEEDNDGLGAYAFKRVPAPAITPLWQLPGQYPLNYRDFATSMRSFPSIGLLATDLTGDGTPDLVTGDADGVLRVLDTSQGAMGAPPVAASAVPPPYDRIFAAPADLDGKPVLATEWSDGLFRLHTIAGGSLVEAAPPGVHFDGFHVTGYWRSQEAIPVVASLAPGEPASVIVVDASHNTHALDVSKANAKTPPEVRWSMTQALGPVVIPNLAGGAPGVALLQHQPLSSPSKTQIVAITGEGKPLWTAPLDGTTSSDLLVGNLDGDGVPDIVASWSHPDDAISTVHTRAISGASGATIWDGATYTDYLITGPAIADWNGDGRDDVFSESFGIVVLSGQDGSMINPPPAENAQNAMPVLVDTNGDNQPEVVLQGGYSKLTVVSSDLTTVLYKSQEAQSTIQYGAIAQCPGGPRHVGSTYFYHTSRLTLTDLGPPTVGNMTALYLAAGQVFPDEASATAAGLFQGVLTSVSVHENLTGKGHPSAVVGSNDGWLYAIDPCTGTLDFAYDFKDAVGVTVFGDTDGDGLDEMIVEVSDGYVYGVKQFVEETGGSGGTGTVSSTSSTGSGGAGASGGAGGATGGDGGSSSRRPDQYLIYGRVTCVCGAAGASADDALAPLFAGGLATALAFRRRRRSSRLV